jgi:hypothetical protein
LQQHFKIAAFFLLAAFLFSCVQNTGQKDSKTENATSLTNAPVKAISVELIGIVRTRRSYSSLQVIDNEKERDVYFAKQQKSNPELELGYNNEYEDSFLVNQFTRLGLIRKGQFLLHKFKKQTKGITGFNDNSGERITIKFYSDDSSHTHFKVFCRKDSTDISTHAISLQDLDYAFLDIIRGGNKELVFLNDYHISNGDNFDLEVYEIKIY